MDPITAFGTAVNVLQVVQFGIKIIQKTYESSKSGGIDHLDSFQQLNQQLLASNGYLSQSLAERRTNDHRPGPLRALWLANEECLNISASFVNLMDDFKHSISGTKLRNGMFHVSSILCCGEDGIENVFSTSCHTTRPSHIEQKAWLI